MLDLNEGRASVAMARWGPGVHQQAICARRREEGNPVSATARKYRSTGSEFGS